jgi:hypothetical protein
MQDKINKQETLEEAKQRILNSNYMNLNDADIFEMGAKWQQEQGKNKYSEEEVLEFANYFGTANKENLKWFEKFIKK